MPLLTQLPAGELVWPGWPCDAPLRWFVNRSPVEWSDVRSYDRAASSRELGLDSAAVDLRLYNSERVLDSRFMQAALIDSPVPYYGWKDLAQDIRLGPQLERFEEHTRIEIVALLPVRLREAREHADGVDVLVDWRDIPGARVSVAFVPLSGDRPQRQRVMLTHGDTTPQQRTVSFSGARAGGRIVLSRSRHLCDMAIVGRPPGRAAAFEHLDPGFRRLAEWLAGGGRGGRTLEQAFAWLLHVAGFSAAHVGTGLPSDAPDVVAFDGEQRMLVCECTQEAVTPEKLAKLVDRARSLQLAASTDTHPVSTVAVAVTAAEMSEAEIAALAPRDVSVALLTRTDLSKLVEGVNEGDGAEAVWRRIQEAARPPTETERMLRSGGRLPNWT